MGGSPARAWAEFKARVEELGGEVLEPHWLGSAVKHRVRCKYDHEASPRPNAVQRGQGICRACSGSDPATAWAQFKARVEELGETVAEPEWLGKATPHRVICANGHPFTPTPNNMRTGTGRCLKCVGIDPAACWEWFKARVEELGGTVVEPEWLGDGIPHWVICREGHDAKPAPTSVKQGQGICRRCTRKVWDVFYVLEDEVAGHVKFGITSGDPRPRLRTHFGNGFKTERLVVRDLPGDFAPVLETSIRLALADAGVEAVRGREYFPISATGLILSIVQQRLGEIDR